MSTQLSLFDLPPAPAKARSRQVAPTPLGERTHRLFFALFPDPETQSALTRLAEFWREKHQMHRPALRPERFHVTLHHLGDFFEIPPPFLEEAGNAASRLVRPAFDVVFDRAESFPRRTETRPFVLRGGSELAELMAFQRALGESLGACGLGGCVAPTFTPHLTLLYDEQFVAVPHPVEPVRWRAREFVLIHSRLGKTEHARLGGWPLRE